MTKHAIHWQPNKHEKRNSAIAEAIFISLVVAMWSFIVYQIVSMF